MNIKVLFTRGDRCYVVQKGTLFYLLDLDIDTKPLVSEYVDSFLKFGYFFPVNEIGERELQAIESKLSKDVL
jgi:hypothetical protein